MYKLIYIQLIFTTIKLTSGFGFDQEQKLPPVKTDIPYIKCQVCEHLIKNAHRTIQERKAEQKPGKKLTEIDVMNYLEKICDPEDYDGEWISMLDIVIIDNKLKLKQMQYVGECFRECRTIAKACLDIIEAIDVKLSEELFKGNKKRAELNTLFCYIETKSCLEKPKDIPKDRWPGEEFFPMLEDDYKYRRSVKQIKDLELNAQVFDQDSAMRFVNDYAGVYNDDDDDIDLNPDNLPFKFDAQKQEL